MTKKKIEPIAINLRLDAEIVEDLDRVAGLLSQAAKGTPISRVDAIRTLLRRGIDLTEKELLT